MYASFQYVLTENLIDRQAALFHIMHMRKLLVKTGVSSAEEISTPTSKNSVARHVRVCFLCLKMRMCTVKPV